MTETVEDKVEDKIEVLKLGQKIFGSGITNLGLNLLVEGNFIDSDMRYEIVRVEDNFFYVVPEGSDDMTRVNMYGLKFYEGGAQVHFSKISDISRGENGR
jgi:hypothetical protein